MEGGWIEDRSVEPTELIATERSAVVDNVCIPSVGCVKYMCLLVIDHIELKKKKF